MPDGAEGMALPSHGAELPAGASTASPGAILRLADQARDAGHWAEAASLYAAALAAGPEEAAIRIQLGNMLKEAGQPLQAEAAYRAALAAAPDCADGWLQLGHLLKRLGRREAAASAYQNALARDALSGDAAAELAALGQGWRIGEAQAAGRSLLYETLAAVQELRRSLALLEARLPAIESLAAVPLHRFDLYAARYRPRLPAGAARVRLDLLLLPGETAPAEAAALVGSLVQAAAAAPGMLRRLGLVTADRALAAMAERHFRPILLDPRAPPALWLPEGDVADWVLVAAGPAILCDTALAWFAHAAAHLGPDATALICDEVLREAPGAPPQPVLLPGYDPRALAAAGLRPSLFAIRRSLLAGAATAEALLAAAAAAGRVIHLPRMLAERRRPPVPPAPAPRGAVAPLAIRVIVPTREAGPLLERCLDAASGQAARPGLLRWTVIDNRPEDAPGPATARPGATLLRRPEGFNWSAFNNLAARTVGEELLLFLNDDVELLTPGWDLALAEAFADPEVAAAGMRLLYPDGRVQHAGVVLGLNGRTEHEGRGAERDAPGPLRRWVSRRRAAAVTGAALACRASAFRDCGGFDADELPVWFNDIDFCLKLRAAGHEVLFLGDVEAVHQESRSLRSAFDDAMRDAAWGQALGVMQRRWGDAFTEDPTLNPHFSRVGEAFEMIAEPSEARVLGWLRAQG
ncbi:glycosyltransferase [Belnapia sp. T18]|uniref:Glycosyltransferase n=1 Tax=Belnapia arida TaxID=2804533 RepID=A0ABS1U5B3_9PROT|nr:glycosyltransferase [Belnapia arida]MBL6079857.1 glycosyltransferase [Belnapia arida]